MNLFLVNMLLAVGAIALLVLALWAIGHLRNLAVRSIMRKARLRGIVVEPRMFLLRTRIDLGLLSTAAAMEGIRGVPNIGLRRTMTVFRVLNIATTIAALIPLGFAVYNLITNNQTQAFTFNLVSLATVLVTKGGLFLLTLVLVPMLKAVSAGMGTTFGGIIAHKLWKRAEGRRRTTPSE